MTISVAILVSGLVSLSLTPMLCSRFLRAAKDERHGTLWTMFERFFDGLLRVYDRTLQVTLRHKIATMAVSVAVAVATGYLFMAIPKGFLPDEDQGQIFIFTEGPQGISFDNMVEHQMALNQIVLAQPYIDSFMSTAAGGNAGRIFARLKPRSERKSAQEIIQELRGKLAAVPGINAFPQMLPTIRIGGQLTKSQYQFTLQGS